MVKTFLFIIAGWTIILAACQNDAQVITMTPPVISEEKSTISAVTPTSTLAPSTATSTVEPNATLPPVEPTQTLTPAPSSTPTETPIPVTAVKSITLHPVLEGVFSRPVYLTHAFDERLFVIEQAGIVRIIKEGQLLEQPFLDIRDRVGSGQLEQGLLSIAFHPDYPQDDRFFVYYTDKSGDVNISSFSVSAGNEDTVDIESEIILLSVDQPYPNHNGGQLQFGPDGYLYAGLGDGGSANDPLNNGQDPGTLLGTLLRLDVDFSDDIYAVPATNPFVSDDGRRNEIWAWGLRNPWRFSFDRLTGDLFIADVGQNVWEEVHFQNSNSVGGENYGWNILEGSHCFLNSECDTTGMELPIFEYDHQGHCSITGGYIYRGTQHLSLYGNYFVADFCSGNIWSLIPDSNGSWRANNVLDTEYVVSSFGEDYQGELYLLDHNLGSIYQLQP